MKVTLRQQLDAFEQGRIIDTDGGENGCFNFYDWFCKDSSLKNKSIKLFNQVKTFIKHNPQINLDKHYVFFKNNCPMVGSLYDDFRICDIEERDVQFTVIGECGHSGEAEIWGVSNGFKEAIKTADTFSKLFVNN